LPKNVRIAGFRISVGLLYIHVYIYICINVTEEPQREPFKETVLSESRCALRLHYVDLVVSIEVDVEVCCCFTVFSC
jgi:hypothetical protein